MDSGPAQMAPRKKIWLWCRRRNLLFRTVCCLIESKRSFMRTIQGNMVRGSYSLFLISLKKMREKRVRCHLSRLWPQRSCIMLEICLIRCLRIRIRWSIWSNKTWIQIKWRRKRAKRMLRGCRRLLPMRILVLVILINSFGIFLIKKI